MHAFLNQSGLFIAIQIATATALLWSYRRQYPPSQNYLAASIDKQCLLRVQTDPRLIFVGGSSVAFGVDSARIAAACGRRPVNMGLHAALGLKWMLRETEQGLRPGDCVIVSPEYAQLSNLSGESQVLVNLLEIDIANASLLDRHQWAEAFDVGFVKRAGTITRAILGRPNRFFRTGSLTNSTSIYLRPSFNANGDMVAHLSNHQPQISTPVHQFRYHEEMAREFLLVINAFAMRAKERGAQVFFSHPPLPEASFLQHRPEWDKLEKMLKAELKIPLLDCMDEMAFPSADFFDTWHHLASTGIEKRTTLLSGRIQRQADGANRVAPATERAVDCSEKDEAGSH